MSAGLNRMGALFAAALKWLRAEHGNIAPLIALTVVPMVGAFAVATETGSWWTYQRAQQNAADSAVVAAAIKGATSEGNVVATKYGYTDSTNNVTVTWNTGTGLCPANVANLVSGASCYEVVINRKVPLYLSQIVGFTEPGTVIGTAPAKTISAGAIAGTIASTSAYCIGANDQIVMNGGGSSGPNAFQGCSLIAGGGMTCSGTNAAGGVLYGASPSNGNNGGQNTCGTPTTDNVYSDPYAARIGSGITSLTSCNSTQTGGGAVNTALLQQGKVNCLSGGDWTLGAWDATSDNTIIKVSGGNLTLTGKLSTSGSGTMTVAFTGQTTNATGVLAFATGGSLDVLSPTNTAWNNNVAIAVDPALQGGTIKNGTFTPCTAATNKTCPQDITTSGNTTINVTGLIYDPNGTVTLSGAISKASEGTDICILFWAKNIVGNGGEAYGVPAPGKNCYNRDSTVPTINVVALLK